MKFILLSLFIFCVSWAHADIKIPDLTGPVVDQVGYINSEDRAQLENILRDYNAVGKAQIQVLVVSDLQGEEIESYSIKVVDAWKLGDKKRDNGILLLVAAQERKTRIEVGQGLEGALPDAYAKRIISQTLIPAFKAKKYSQGIVASVYDIIHFVDQEYAGQKLPEPKSAESENNNGLYLLFILFFVVLTLNRIFRGGGRGGGFYGGGYGGGFGGGGWTSGSGGGGSSWSGGGGGFSGGGASGSW